MTAPIVDRSVRFTVPTSPVARVFHQVRAGTTDRPSLQAELGLSQASITRHVSALIEAGLLEEVRPDAADTTRTGRPRARLAVDGRHSIVWAAHIGVRSSVLVIADLAGRIIREAEIPFNVRRVPAEATLDRISTELAVLGAGLPNPANIGIAFSAHVDRDGLVSSPTYGWSGVDPARFLPFPASLGIGVAAMASTEIIHTPLDRSDASILYFYAREVIAHAWILHGTVHRPHSGRTPSAFTGMLSNSATLEEAARRGIRVTSLRELARIAQTGGVAREILDARARDLGRAVAAAVDVVDPETVVFAGEAFTVDPEGLRLVVRTLRRHTGNPGQLRIQRADPNILRTAAVQVALDPIRQDPLAFA